ncbi:MAG: ABC transporter substrate-binding protein [Deltaproteobacteria bacterium]|nr:ABC transporter substrate-binding protein [Deltaproteobacteria bacterium]MBM4296712.1 ABC transporter substrate-binding protein [Deltaproteobacteria bacterium]
MNFTRFFLIAVVLSYPSCLTPAAAASAPHKMVISYAALSEREGALLVARDQGFFRKQGLDVELVYMPSAPVALASIAHGDSQVNTGSASGAILGAMAGGLDLVFVAGLINKLSGVIIAAPNINSPADLKGKTIGVTSIGGGNWVFTMLALEHWKLDVKRDNITIRVIGNDAVRAQAITNGTIDATQLSAYSLVAPLKRQGARVLADLPDLGVPYQGVTVFTRRSYLNQNADAMEKLLTGIVEAIAFIQDPTNKAAVMRILAKGLRLAKPEDTADGYENVKTLFERKIYPTVNGVRNTIRLLGQSNEKIRALRAEDLIDDRIVRRLEQKGLFR